MLSCPLRNTFLRREYIVDNFFAKTTQALVDRQGDQPFDNLISRQLCARDRTAPIDRSGRFGVAMESTAGLTPQSARRPHPRNDRRRIISAHAPFAQLARESFDGIQSEFVLIEVGQ